VENSSAGHFPPDSLSPYTLTIKGSGAFKLESRFLGCHPVEKETIWYYVWSRELPLKLQLRYAS